MGEKFRFLFDECLTPNLVGVANGLGYAAHHVVYLGKARESDIALAVYARDNDVVFVTNNRVDYVKIYRQFELHAGLIVIVPSVPLAEQQRLFTLVVDHIAAMPDLINKLIEIDETGDITLIDWPPLLPNSR